MNKPREVGMTFKPIGFAFAAVVAGVAPGAQAAQTEQVRTLAPQPAVQEEDETLLLGPSTPVEPFAQPAKKQGDLFDL